VRLLDSSTWIAFHNVGRIEVLLRLPDLAITRRVLGELRGKLGNRVEAAIQQGRVQIIDSVETPAEDLTWILLSKGARTHVSEADAGQVALAAARPGTILYMRDARAEALDPNADIRWPRDLVDDMVELGLTDPEGAVGLKADLDAYFTPPRMGRMES
jgi:predicted nucleic acid-binding protein